MFKHTEPEFLKIKVGDSKVAADIIVISSSARNSCPTAPCACLRHCQREPGVPAPAPACSLPPAGAPCWSPHRWGGHAPGRRTSLPRIANSAVVYLSKSFFFFSSKENANHNIQSWVQTWQKTGSNARTEESPLLRPRPQLCIKRY